ncbi:hypothetical protein FQR65_LT12612 [Abscondita terminalis]|nr:hypothetical protein FQR65_LT12612 [Abscondita terminalis]
MKQLYQLCLDSAAVQYFQVSQQSLPYQQIIRVHLHVAQPTESRQVRRFGAKWNYSACSCSIMSSNHQLNEEQFDSVDIFIHPPAEDSDEDLEWSDNTSLKDFAENLPNAPADTTIMHKQPEEDEETLWETEDDEPLINFRNKKRTKLSLATDIRKKVAMTNITLLNVCAFCCIFLFPGYVQLARPSIIDIKQLELLYKIGSDETHKLVKEAKIPIELNVNIGMSNITQMKKQSLQKITNSAQQNQECLKIYESQVSKVSPDFLLYCNQSTQINAAINRWGVVEAHIMFCSMSTNSDCVDDIKKEISRVRTENQKDIPEAARRSYSCRIAQTDAAARAIEEAEQHFYLCNN